MLMECDREKSISFIPHSYSICFSRARERERGGGGGGDKCCLFSPCNLFDWRIRQKKEKTNYLAHRCVIFHYVFQLKKKPIPLSHWLPRIHSTTEQTISQQLGFTVETSRIQLHRWRRGKWTIAARHWGETLIQAIMQSSLLSQWNRKMESERDTWLSPTAWLT